VGQDLQVQIMHDPSNHTARTYNALWFPRAYALDAQGNISYVQRDSITEAIASFEIYQLWEKTSKANHDMEKHR
jgi:hypothetical protein